MLFICPKCSSPLTVDGATRAARCERGHSYDRSREGYYNFLPPMKASSHGDNREMISVRRDFLDTGAYLPLADALCDAVRACAHDLNDEMRFLDVGCGEGYYTARVFDTLRSDGTEVSTLAFDISKDAVRLAARRLDGAQLCVASAYRMPLPDGCIDLAMNVFSPLALEETLRVIRSGGYFVMAIPNADHLFELKSVLYDTPYKNEVKDFALPGFELMRTAEVDYVMHLDTAEKIRALFAMTPYAYRTGEAGKARLYSLDRLDVGAHFIIIVYKKI